MSASLMHQHSESPPMAIRTVITNAEKEKEHVRGKPSTSNGMGNGMSNGGSWVAIFRDREKDRRDPDYDRNTSRFLFSPINFYHRDHCHKRLPHAG